MIYNLNKYRRVIKPQIQNWCDARNDETPISMIGAISIATSCPIVVVCYLIGEIYGVNEELTLKTKKLEEFYSVNAVIL